MDSAQTPALLPEVHSGQSGHNGHSGRHDADQLVLPLAAEGVQRFVWEGAFGAVLIEVRDGCAFVNGQKVIPAEELRKNTG
jgi:hypothetical protein